MHCFILKSNLAQINRTLCYSMYFFRQMNVLEVLPLWLGFLKEPHASQ